MCFSVVAMQTTADYLHLYVYYWSLVLVIFWRSSCFSHSKPGSPTLLYYHHKIWTWWHTFFFHKALSDLWYVHHARWICGVIGGRAVLRRRRRIRGGHARAHLPVGWSWAQGDAAQEVQRLPQPPPVRVPEEEEEREAAQGCPASSHGLVEHTLPLALPYGRW